MLARALLMFCLSIFYLEFDMAAFLPFLAHNVTRSINTFCCMTSLN